jgi:hypothetical protein
MEDIVEFIGYATGELLLCLLTLGRHKPNWNYADAGTHHELRVHKSAWLGLIFWGAVFLLTTWLIAMR